MVLLAAISGAVLWLTLMAPSEEKAAPPTAKMDLGSSESPKASGESPKAPVAQKPAAPAPKTTPETDTEHPPKATIPAEPKKEVTPERVTTPATPEPPVAGSSLPAAPMTKEPEPVAEVKPPVTEAPKPPPPAIEQPATENLAEKKPPIVVLDDPAMAPPLVSVIPKLPRPPPSAPLPQAPDPALIENTKNGPLPIVGRDGREAWRVYSRPFNRDDKRPRIAIVLYGLGSSAAATQAAIQALPGAVSLAFSPYADNLRNWIADARAAGHETLLMVPMEPRNFPQNDPGPQALLTSLTNKQNVNRLEWILGRAVGYVGVTDFMGSRFTNSTPHMKSFFRNLKLRGLMYLESNTASRITAGEIASANRVPFVPNALYIDNSASRAAIDAQLIEAERLARSLGEIAVMGFLYPVTLERVANWAKTATKRGFVLAPVSALAKRR